MITLTVDCQNEVVWPSGQETVMIATCPSTDRVTSWLRQSHKPSPVDWTASDPPCQPRHVALRRSQQRHDSRENQDETHRYETLSSPLSVHSINWSNYQTKLSSVGPSIPFNTLLVIFETIFPANLSWLVQNTQPSQPITWMILTKLNLTTANQHKNLNNHLWELVTYVQTTTKKLKPELGKFNARPMRLRNISSLFTASGPCTGLQFINPWPHCVLWPNRSRRQLMLFSFSSHERSTSYLKKWFTGKHFK